MHQKRHPKILVIAVISLFLVSCFVTFAQTSATSTNTESQFVAQPMYVLENVNPMSQPSKSSYWPINMTSAYGLPTDGGSGSTIAIIDPFKTPNVQNDLATFSSQFNLPAPTSSNFQIYPMSPNLQTGSSNWQQETTLDVEWAHAIAPEAKILLVEAINEDSDGLLSAVDYAASQPNVVAISMSWGGNETQFTSASEELSLDSNFISNYGAVFFASAGDNGAEVNWPACSPNVVAVGGTTLYLNNDGTVSSEMAWSGSGGGVSIYEPAPAYQTFYGLTYGNRAVPDVSYDANPSTGVAVYYNGGWLQVGGTSIGAPQWAAIQADGLSATNANLYGMAKLAYSSHFRDITSGNNGAYNATAGYDLVTGLGSPLTDDFVSLAVSPTSGPAGCTVTINGQGFTASSSVTISYLNNSAWVPLASDVPTSSTQSFTYSFPAPDLLLNNIAGDNPPLSDNIVFQAIDNRNGYAYNTTIPYTEMRRGLTQVGNAAANGVFGNSTDLSTTVFVQNGQPLVVAGEWFSPGNATFLWDNTTNLGTAPIDGTGSFNATVTVPTTTAGPHTLTINDADSSFCVSLTRVPTVANDYDGSWHTSNFTINLTPDYNITETYYTINGGPVENVSADGQPFITTEGANNTLEYWSTWNIYGTGLMVTLPPVTLTGIELDMTPPQALIQIDGGESTTDSTAITITVNATDPVSGVSQMRFSNDDTWDQALWEPYTNSISWQLTSGDGAKTVYCQIQDNAGLITTVNASVTLSTNQPMASSSPEATSTPQPSPNTSPSPTPNPFTPSAPTASPSATASASPTPSTPPVPTTSSSPQAPELSIQMVLIMLALPTILFSISCIRKVCKKP